MGAGSGIVLVLVLVLCMKSSAGSGLLAPNISVLRPQPLLERRRATLGLTQAAGVCLAWRR